jgi:tRNA-dihydrouridine synthase
MEKESKDLYSRLGGGLFLSSMMTVTDGAFCAQRSAGCVLVQLGAYLAEPTVGHEAKGADARSFLPSDWDTCTQFLAEECRSARSVSDVLTCLNLATPRLDWGLKAAKSFSQAGGDLVELNVHGGYRRYLDQGKLRAMILPQHQPELFRWIEAFTGLEIPLIVKFNGQHDREVLLDVLDRMREFDLFGIHVNARDAGTRQPDLEFVRQVKRVYPGFLLVSGYARSGSDVAELFNAGADAVGIAEPTMADAGYIGRIVEEFEAQRSASPEKPAQ